MTMIKPKHALLTAILLCSNISVFANDTTQPQARALDQVSSSFQTRPVLKLTNEQFVELVADDNYEPTHSDSAYPLYMTDIGYGNSDQYIDEVVRFALNATADQMLAVVDEKVKSGAILKSQAKEMKKVIKTAEKNQQFDTAFKANFAVELDNQTARNILAKKNPEIVKQSSDEAQNFKKFDVNEYYNQKFSVYMRTVQSRFNNLVSPYEQKEWEDTAYITPATTVYKVVSESNLKPKLRSLVANEVRYGSLSDHEKKLILWWMDQLK